MSSPRPNSPQASLLNRVRVLLGENWEIVLGGIILSCAQTIVPGDHPLADPTLMPWLMLCLSFTALLRARPLGDGPHPMLNERRSFFLGLFQRLAVTAIPGVVLALFLAARSFRTSLVGMDAGFGAVGLPAAIGVVGIIVVTSLLLMTQNHGRTAWDPPGINTVFLTVAYVGVVLGGVVVLGAASAMIGPDSLLAWLPQALTLGVAFLTVGLALGRVQNLRQRFAARRRDGGPYRPGFFRIALALLGPSLGLWVLLQLYVLLTGSVGFEQAWVLVFHVLSWSVVLWPARRPVAVHCLLHEVVPVGGADEPEPGTAASFEEAPEGALRINPIDLRRTRTIQAWTVPVRASRIEELDDPIRPLWSRPAPLTPSHVLGEAAFEPDPATLAVQTERITLHLRGGADIASLSGGAQVRRVVVLQPFPEPGESRRPRPRTYRWEPKVPAVCVQIVDAATQSIHMINGSILVLSTEGIARAYELEIGAPVYDWEEAMLQRPPQLEDYVAT